MLENKFSLGDRVVHTNDRKGTIIENKKCPFKSEHPFGVKYDDSKLPPEEHDDCISIDDLDLFELIEPNARHEDGDGHFILKDSGKRESFGTGAVRDTQEDKPRYDLIPPHALKRVADVYTKGAIKYGDRNWEKGIPFERCTASAIRHLEAFRMGVNDEDHLAQCVWNLLAIMEFQETGRLDLDDMKKYDRKKV